MSLYTYNAYDVSGKEVSGKVEAADLAEARKRLKQDGLYAKEVRAEAASVVKSRFARPSRGVSTIDLSTATRQLSTLLSSGAPLLEAMDMLIEETRSESFTKVLKVVREEVTGGSSLASALAVHARVFPEMYVRMVEAGEESGTLDAVLMRLADYLEARARILERVRTAFLYPAVVTTVLIAVLGFLLAYVVPSITRIFEDSDAALPFVTTVVLAVSSVVSAYWPAILISIVLGIYAVIKFRRYPSFKARFDKIILKIPVVGPVLKLYYNATLSRTLGSLLHSGVPILKALDMTGGVLDHTVYEEIFTNARKDVTEGAPLSATFREATILPGLLVHMTAIGERSGKLDQMLLKAGETYENDFERAVTRALAFMEPALIVILGVVVGFVVLAILLPIFDLNQLLAK